MLQQEYPLLLFTLLGQAAAGLFIAGLLARELLGRQLGYPEAATLTRRAPQVALGLLIAAGLVAFAHLGSPLGAFGSMNNVISSPLAQEIAACGLFGVLLVAGLALEVRQGAAGWARYVGWFAGLSGALMVIAVSRVYTATIIPAWTSVFTPISFVCAALALGSVILLVVVPRSVSTIVGIVAGVGLLGLAVQLFALPFYLAELGRGPAVAQQALSIITQTFQPVLVTLLLVAGVTATALIVIWQRHTLGRKLVYLALIAGIVTEAAARVLFYASAVPIHVGI